MPEAYAAQKIFSAVDTRRGRNSLPIQVGPGDQGVPLFVGPQRVNTQPIISLTALLFLPNGFSSMSGSTVAVAKAVALAPNSIFQLVFALDIGTVANLGAYTCP